MKNTKWLGILVRISALVLSLFALSVFAGKPADAEPGASCELTWSAIPSPNVGNSPSYLTDLAVVSANDIWVVGGSGTYSSNTSLIMHWDGTSWSTVPSPNPDANHNSLYSISALAANDIWAFGDFGSSGVQALHWDGNTWNAVSGLSFPAFARYSAIVPPNELWAYGDVECQTSPTLCHPVFWRKQGDTWQKTVGPDYGYGFHSPPPEMRGLSGTGPNDIWAVGTKYETLAFPSRIILYWDGTT
ncbi:MAG: hypothetical protein HY741_25880 [Chloroflexi bacterium]|nr:hypothetical protein [Chloroflexota bacterium]